MASNVMTDELAQLKHSAGSSKHTLSNLEAQPVAGSSKTLNDVSLVESKAPHNKSKGKPLQEDYLVYKGRGRYAQA